jgi:hypothetical protein
VRETVTHAPRGACVTLSWVGTDKHAARAAVALPTPTTGPPLGTSPPTFEPATLRTIGRFELIREIARGGMGHVFLGRDTRLGRRVAIKFMLRGDPDFVARFLVEARATARCTHENIVTIYEVGEHEGLPYMVLEYLEGRTLADMIDTGISMRELADVMVPVLRALERAHEHGIVHRDLKPSNIFVTDRGHVKVLDFGVATLIEEPDAETDSLVGTLPFMSPEQWGAGAIDDRSDLWALGIIFWYALANTHPVGSDVPEVVRALLLDLDTPLPSIGKRGVPGELAAIVDRCLAKRPADRYQDATAVLADLQAFLAPRTNRESVPSEATPYRGLVAFGEHDAPYFFGRTSEIRTARAQLDARPLLVVVGSSGVGKSSFVHAGLVPALRDGEELWVLRVVRPGRHPLQRLAAILEDALETGGTGGDFAAQLLEAPGLFGSKLREAAVRDHTRYLVVVDQLEELFTLCDRDETRRVFLAALLSAADDPSSPIRVVMSLRADFLDRLTAFEQFQSEISRCLHFLSAPDRESLRETLLRPAEIAGYAFEDPSIVDDMLQAANSPGALPLLSFAAMRLWEARDRERRLLTVAAYEAMRGVGGAFAQHADQVASTIANQQLLRAVVTRLVTPDGTRAVVDRDELYSLAPGTSDVERILDQLEHARLIQKHAEPDQPVTVEIVHEMLITEWPTLRRWLDDNHHLRGFMHELGQAARQWTARGKPADLVWHGATAQEALLHAKRHVLDLAALEREFLTAIAAQSTRRRRRRVMAVVSAFAALGLVIAGGGIALVQIRAAKAEAVEQATALGEALAKTQQAQSQQQQAESERARAERLANDANKAQSQTKEQLVVVNSQLVEKVRQLEAAQAQAESEQARARAEEQRARGEAARAKQATAEAQAAKQETETLLAAKRKELEALQRKMKDIIDVDLRGKK